MLYLADIHWQMPHQTSLIYPIMMLLAMLFGAYRWQKNNKGNNTMLMVYISAIGGAFLGAKIIYMLSEGYLITSDNPYRLQAWLTGKSILGGLLGGYLCVEGAKKCLGIKQATGDLFAITVPLGIALGRLGCLAHGCCKGILIQGQFLWPAPLVELVFNLILAGVLYSLKRKQKQVTQLFHIYLISYGIFRFLHEYLRETPKIILGVSGYQIAALIMLIFGIIAYLKRNKLTV